MKAAQFFGRGDLRVVDVPKPESKENEAIVNIEWCGICGSDLHEYIAGLLHPRSWRGFSLT
jgi:threonine dehydrogenase-like Zn-dependent dehydrogenase